VSTSRGLHGALALAPLESKYGIDNERGIACSLTVAESMEHTVTPILPDAGALLAA
jgi:hypothetical protein